MTPTQRRIYMSFFIILFLFTAPILILFAKGYRFDRASNIFVHSGSITIKSWPRDIDIYVDGKKREKSNLNIINNSYTVNGIRPGTHLVTCQKSGYTSWSKQVQIHSGVSTEFWNVLLFPIENREISSFDSSEIEQFFISPRKESEIVYFFKDGNKNQVALLDTKKESNEIIFETEEFSFVDPSEEENVEWSSDNKRILIPFEKKGETVYVIAKIKKDGLQDIVNLNEIFAKALQAQTDTTPSNLPNPNKKKTVQESVAFHKARWMFNKNDEVVILTKNKELFYYDITKPNQKILIDKNVNGFDFAGNRIYYSQLPNNIVWEIKNSDIKTKRQITQVPIPDVSSDFLRLTVYDQCRISIETQEGNLYVHNEEKEKGETQMYDLGANVRGIQFSDDGKKIAYWTSNEIWYLTLREWKVQPTREKGNKIFITRFSSPIKNVQWMDDYENILFTVNGSVKSANIDTRWTTHITDVYEQEQPFEDRLAIYNKRNQTLHFVSHSKDDKKIFNSMLLIDKGFFIF